MQLNVKCGKSSVKCVAHECVSVCVQKLLHCICDCGGNLCCCCYYCCCCFCSSTQKPTKAKSSSTDVLHTFKCNCIGMPQTKWQ